MNLEKLKQLLAEKTKEVRTLNEQNKIDEAEEQMKEVRSLKRQIKLQEEIEADEKRDLKDQLEDKKKEEKEERKETKEQQEVRAFEQFIRGEKRAITKGSNGSLVPTSISSRIINKLKEISPIYSQVEVIDMGGKLVIASGTAGTASYITESAPAGNGTEPSFGTVTLEDFVIKAKALVSNQLINNTDFDIVSYVIEKVAEAIKNFVEKEILVGAGGDSAINGLVNSTNVVSLESTTTALKADDLIDLEMSVKSAYRQGANYYMTTKTLTSLRKLKGTDGHYLLQPDLTGQFSYRLNGKPVYETESMDEVAKGKAPIIFANPKEAYTFKHSKNLEVKVLDELYADSYQTGVLGFLDGDGDIKNNDAVAVLKIASA